MLSLLRYKKQKRLEDIMIVHSKHLFMSFLFSLMMHACIFSMSEEDKKEKTISSAPVFFDHSKCPIVHLRCQKDRILDKEKLFIRDILVHAQTGSLQSVEDSMRMKNYNTQYGFTALHFAATEPSSDLNSHTVKNLLKFGAKPDLCAFFIDQDKIRYITPYELAAIHKNYSALKLLLDWQDKEGKTLLLRAIEFHDSAKIRTLLILGAPVNKKNSKGIYPLHWALEKKQTREIIYSLLLNGADVNSLGDFGQTALHKAAQHMPEAILLLLMYNADVNSKDLAGQTPLFYIKENCFSALQSLVMAGADINIKNTVGYTVLAVACIENNLPLVKLLVKIKNIEINSIDDFGLMPIDYARRNNNAELVSLLLDYGACQLHSSL